MLARGTLGLLGLAAATCAAATAVPGDSRTERAVREVLLERQPTDPRRPRHVILQLSALGPTAIPTLFELVTGEGNEALWRGDGTGAEDEEPPRWSSSPDTFPEIARRALARQPHADVVRHLDGRIVPDSPIELKKAALRVLETLGSREGLALGLDIVSGIDPLELRYRSVRTPATDWLTSILRRDLLAWNDLEEPLKRVDDDVLELVVAAVSASDRPQGVELLTTLLGRDKELDLIVLRQIAEAREHFPWHPFDPLPRVRWLLGDDDARLRREAASTVGRLHDLEAVPTLVDLLEEEDERVCRSAEWALQRIAGTGLPKSPDEWQIWFERETTWWARESGEHLAGLRSDDAAEVGEALRALSRRPVFRHEAAVAIAATLPGRPPAVAIAMCSTLRELDSRHALPGLVAALDAGDDMVRAAAWTTLQRLTGASLPPDSARWRELLH